MTERRFSIGNVAVHRAQAPKQSLGIANHYLIGGRLVSDQERDDDGSVVEMKGEQNA
ncbi:hypothetical protein [Candidatus Accumulibacter sp. ACC003]|uniref:hypothetical protein n=1 Tax=Candidatus Accumulibacter sp. ACC003 TaxID=2823334 RepID=UPI0025BC4471|nr:hypothetical protein [Candidatus Accumulibacter sp. ACC003]